MDRSRPAKKRRRQRPVRDAVEAALLAAYRAHCWDRHTRQALRLVLEKS